MSENQYSKKADLLSLHHEGELVSQAIVEGKEGLKNIREIAAVKALDVLWPGAGSLRGAFSTAGSSTAGSLRGAFSTTEADGKPVLDEAAREASIQQVLAACKEFNVPCSDPGNAKDVELHMRQGFSVFITGWGDSGFKAVELGRKAGNHEAASE